MGGFLADAEPLALSLVACELWENGAIRLAYAPQKG